MKNLHYTILSPSKDHVMDPRERAAAMKAKETGEVVLPILPSGSVRIVSLQERRGSQIYLGGYSISYDRDGVETGRTEPHWNVTVDCGDEKTARQMEALCPLTRSERTAENGIAQATAERPGQRSSPKGPAQDGTGINAKGEQAAVTPVSPQR